MLTENLKIALETLSNNKLRASLTLLGIVIGVFSIISIMTLLSALQLGIEQGLSSLGSNTYQFRNIPQYKSAVREVCANTEIVRILLTIKV